MTKDNIKILIINESLRLGGAESMSVELANALAERQNIKVSFASARGPLMNRLNSNIEFFEIPKYNLFSIPKIINSLSEIIKKIKPDIVHNQGATLSILSGIAIKKTNLKPINILTHHSRKFSRAPSFLAVHLLKKYCNYIIAISESEYKELKKNGVPENKLSLTPNFIDYDKIRNQLNSFDKKAIREELNISENNKIITMIGRLILDKRFDKFIKILAQCSEKSKEKLVGLIIGEGPERKKLERIAYSYPNKVKILFLGYQNNIYKYLSISNIFLFPSEYEVLPMVLVEASASGIPIICSNISGNNDIVKNGYNGFLVNDSKKEYYDCILKLLNNKKLAKRMSNNGIEVAKNKFDKKVVINSIISLYRDLLYFPNKKVYEK